MKILMKTKMMNKKKQYNKLIRDKMLDKIRKDGHNPIFKILTKSELKTELREKLLKEANEVHDSKTKSNLLEELADVYEVISQLAFQNNFSLFDISEKAKTKRNERGGFTKGVFLIEVK